MKAAEVAKRLVELTGKPTNAEALQAIERTLAAAAQPSQPVLVTIAIDPRSGQVTPGVIGLENPTSADFRMVQNVLRQYADALDEPRTEAIRREARREGLAEPE